MEQNNKLPTFIIILSAILFLGLLVNFFLVYKLGQNITKVDNNLNLLTNQINYVKNTSTPQPSPTTTQTDQQSTYTPQSSPTTTQPSPKISDNKISFRHIEITLPVGWKVEKSKQINNSMTNYSIKTDYQPYTVYAGLDIKIVTDSNSKQYYSSFPIRFSVGDIKIFQEDCGGAISCDGAIVGDEIYTFGWVVEDSSQVPPANLDGIWSPEHNITREKIDSILKTIKKI